MVVVMIAFARSGGTILNQCLGSLPDVVMISEVNPLGGGAGDRGPDSFTTVRAQAEHWYQIAVESDAFADSVQELEQACLDSGKHLVIRDWSLVNFLPHRLNAHNPPHRLLTLEALAGRCELLTFAFVRDSIDVWISRGAPDANEFFGHYLKYVKAVQGLPTFKYEDFCSNPARVIRQICDLTGLEYSESWRDYRSFKTVHGDVQTARPSRGRRQGTIGTLPRKRISRGLIAAVSQCHDMIKANELLGYPTSYHSVPREGLGQWLFRKVNSKVRPDR
jgi:hypothetical protein